MANLKVLDGDGVAKEIRVYGGDGSTGNPFITNPEALTVFGERLTAELTPTIQIANAYEIDPATRDDLEVFTATGGSADSLSNMFRCQSGTSVGGYGVIRSAGALRYRPGEGALGRVTAAFTNGIANSLQFAGS